MQVIVYWTGTGNTEDIAKKIQGDLGCDLFNVSEASVSDVLNYDSIILGCPAMGAEELEEDEFKPFYESVMQSIGDKKVALFGSYGWGNGEWMRNWEQEVSSNLATSGLIVNGGVSDIDDASYDEFINALK